MIYDKQILLKYLKSQYLMTITTQKTHLWPSSVYFVTDNKFCLYFLSEPTAIHCKNIAINPHVACSIADSQQKVTDKKIGVQLHGTASKVNSVEKMKWMLKLWNKLNPGFASIVNLKNIQSNKIKSKIYQVKPEMIKFFNEKLYGPEGYKLFDLSNKKK